MKNPWGEYALPRLTDRLLDNRTVRRYRGRVASELSGDVVEIGFGSGLNAEHYPPTITRVVAIEPSMTARRLASDRVGQTAVAVDFAGLDGQNLPLESDSMDGALSTFTLCTIPDAAKASKEVRRVLKPGGKFAFVEHGLSPDKAVESWQHRLNPIQRTLAGGCNLDRRIDRLLTDAGFDIAWLENEQLPGPRVAAPWGYLFFGVAVKA